MRLFAFTAAIAVSMCGAFSQNVPSGWKVVKDNQGACKVAVPGDWKIDTSIGKSPDGKSNVVPNGLDADESFKEATSMVKQMMKPTKTIEDSDKRLLYAYDGGRGSSGTNWYVAVPGKPVCTAQVTFKDPVPEDTAKKIALSLTQAK